MSAVSPTDCTAPEGAARVVPHQGLVGLTLAGAIVAGWLTLHLYGVYVHHWSVWSALIAPAIVAAQTWLSVGLFIIAHDAMHGSLAPGRPRVNRAVGALCLALYAGFSFGRLTPSHHAHHATPGQAGDPDFHPEAPRSFGPWFLRFFRTYFGWREFGVLTALLAIAILVFGARIPNLLVFWALPALLSALQLFIFGTWLPHRHDDDGFADHHNARTSGYGSVVSLLTCFHFGRHHEHHLFPWLPWWRLDSRR